MPFYSMTSSKLECTCTSVQDETSYNGFFKEDGRNEMLVAKYIHIMDSFSLLIGVIADRYYGQERYTPVTDVFVRFVELLALAYCSIGTLG